MTNKLKMFVYYDEEDNLIFFAENVDEANKMIEDYFLNECDFEEVPHYELGGAYPIIRGDGPIRI